MTTQPTEAQARAVLAQIVGSDLTLPVWTGDWHQNLREVGAALAPKAAPAKPQPASHAHRMTVGDLRDRLADLPDWAEVVVVSGGDEVEPPEESDPLLTYSQGLLLIETA